LYHRKTTFATIVVNWSEQEILTEGICIIEPIQVLWYQISLAAQLGIDYPADSCGGYKERIKL